LAAIPGKVYTDKEFIAELKRFVGSPAGFSLQANSLCRKLVDAIPPGRPNGTWQLTTKKLTAEEVEELFDE
jgi:hypothetical protein